MSAAIDTAINACGRLGPQADGKTPDGNQTKTSLNAGGVTYVATQQKYDETKYVTNQSFMQDLERTLVWPGQIIQGHSLTQGNISPFGPLDRMPGTIEVTGLVSGTGASTSATIDSPTSAAVDSGIDDIITALKPTDSVGTTSASYDRADSFEQAGLSAGMSVKGAAFNVNASASLNQDFKSSTVVGVIRQTYYTAAFTPHSAASSGIWRDTGANPVTLSNVQPYMGNGNPPLIINSVQYGRVIVLAVTSSHSSSDIKAALDAHYKSTVEGSGTLTSYQQQIIDTCSAQIYTIGVPGHQNFEDIANPAAELPGVYKAGLSVSWPANPGAVVSFTCLHLADNTMANIGLTASYVQPISIVAEDITDAVFTWFDGPGSVPTDTNIELNPSDHLKISASGQIWAGVAFSGLNGPDGWPGHTPDHNAPVPASDGGTAAYCLVARIGNGKWFEAKSLWEGPVPDGDQGTLVLASNDNDWTNGDPKKHWTITVNVGRTDASSVGLYV